MFLSDTEMRRGENRKPGEKILVHINQNVKFTFSYGSSWKLFSFISLNKTYCSTWNIKT